MTGLDRRQFLAAAGLCWPERKYDSGCKVLGKGVGLPIYRLESRVPGQPFVATFRRTGDGCVDRAAQAAQHWPLTARMHDLYWRRDADGSTHIRQTMEVSVAYLSVFGSLWTITSSYSTDLRRLEMTGHIEFGGLLGPFTGLGGETPEQRALAEPGVTDRARFLAGLREDGSLATDDDPLAFGGIELWRYRQLAVEREARDSVTIDGRSWPVRRIELSAPARPGLDLHPGLTVWVSDELSLVLREEARLNGELCNAFEGVALKVGAGGP